MKTKKLETKKNYYSRLLLIILSLALIYQLFYNVKYYNDRDLEILGSNIFYQLSNKINTQFKGVKFLANDEFIKNWLITEDDRLSLDQYLKEKTELLGCSGIDLASEKSMNVYQSAGTIETLEKEDDADKWYFELIESGNTNSNEIYYDLNSGILYIYINEVIYSNDNRVLGVIGLLISYDDITNILDEYKNLGLVGYLIDNNGEVYLHPDQTKIGNINIYDYFGFLQKSDPKKTNLEKDTKKLTIYKIDGLLGSLVIEKKLYIDYLYLLKSYLIIPILILVYILFIKFNRKK